MTELLAFLSAISATPAILDDFKQLYGWLHSTFGDTWPKYLADLGPVFKDLSAAKTPADKQAVAAQMAKLAERWGVSST